MFQTRVLALGVLTNDAEIDVLVACLVSRNVLEEDNGRIDVELLAKSNVEGAMTRSLNRSVEDALETQLVALERGNGLTQKLFGVHVARINARDIDLLPLNGDIVCLEDLLDRLGNLSTDTVTCALFNVMFKTGKAVAAYQESK